MSHQPAIIYLVTLQTHHQQPLFGEWIESGIQLNEMGRIVADEWIRATHRRSHIALDQWAIAPDSISGIVLLQPSAELQSDSFPAGSIPSGKPRYLSAFIAGFKAAAAKRINLVRNQPGAIVWERSYHERQIASPQLLKEAQQQILLLGR